MSGHKFSIAYILSSGCKRKIDEDVSGDVDEDFDEDDCIIETVDDNCKEEENENENDEKDIEVNEYNKSSTPTAVVRPAQNFNTKNSYGYEKGKMLFFGIYNTVLNPVAYVFIVFMNTIHF